MPTPKEITEARSATWNANQGKWTYFSDHVAGGPDYPAKSNPLARTVFSSRIQEGQALYVVRHPLEDIADFMPRLYRAATVNLCASPISLVCGTIGQPDSVVIDVEPEFGVILDDADATGSSLLQFMAAARKNAATFGHTFIVVDSSKAAGPVLTQADILNQKIRPYCREITPPNMLAWRMDDLGQPLECLFRIPRDSSTSILTAPDKQTTEYEYRLWTREEWIAFREVDGHVDIVDRGINPIHTVPVSVLYHSKISPWLGDSLVKEAAKYSQLATNWLSDLDAVTVQQSFSQACLRSMNPPAQVGIGASKVLHLSPALKNKGTDEEIGESDFFYRSPDTAPIATMWDGFMRLVDLANASMDLRPEASTDKAHPESGISRAWRWHAAEKRLIQMAVNEQESVKQILYLSALWMGQPNFSGSASYSMKYDLSSVEDGITNMIALQSAGLPPTAQREMMRAAILKTLPNLDQKTQNAINTELERIGAMPMDPRRMMTGPGQNQ